jgi:hypothetical protein
MLAVALAPRQRWRIGPLSFISGAFSGDKKGDPSLFSIVLYLVA